uniref:Uncharacterized protein n=1 Tax=Panstrongylus lignarius TaxID=156445 RepID=A0A224XW80_9HEMI
MTVLAWSCFFLIFSFALLFSVFPLPYASFVFLLPFFFVPQPWQVFLQPISFEPLQFFGCSPPLSVQEPLFSYFLLPLFFSPRRGVAVFCVPFLTSFLFAFLSWLPQLFAILQLLFLLYVFLTLPQLFYSQGLLFF